MPITSAELRRHLEDADLAGLRRRLSDGELDVLRSVLGEERYLELGRRLGVGDIGWLRDTLGAVELPEDGTGPARGDPPVRNAVEPDPPERSPAAGHPPTGLAATPPLRGESDATAPRDPRHRRRRRLAAAAALGLVVAGALVVWAMTGGPSGERPVSPALADPDAGAEPASVLAVVGADARLGVLAGLLASSGLDETLAGPGPFTLFAPTDDALVAFAAAGDDAASTPASQRELLSRHVLAGKVTLADLSPGVVRTIGGARLALESPGGARRVGGATIVDGDHSAPNGVVHVIDAVVVAAGAAVAAPEHTTTSTTPPAELAALVRSRPELSTLVALIDRAEAWPTLETGPLTLFAPDDATFAQLDPDVRRRIESDPDLARAILQRHLVRSTVTRADLGAGPLSALDGSVITVGRMGDQVTIGGARLVGAQLVAGTGVVHVVDHLLGPEALGITNAATAPGAPTPPTAVTPPSSVAPAPPAAPEPSPAGPVFTVYFETDETVVRTGQFPVIEAALAEMASRPTPATVLLIGLADTRGDPEVNRALSFERAEAVRIELLAGAPDLRVSIEARGAEPTEDLATARRVEIHIG